MFNKNSIGIIINCEHWWSIYACATGPLLENAFLAPPGGDRPMLLTPSSDLSHPGAHHDLHHQFGAAAAAAHHGMRGRPPPGGLGGLFSQHPGLHHHHQQQQQQQELQQSQSELVAETWWPIAAVVDATFLHKWLDISCISIAGARSCVQVQSTDFRKLTN